MEYMINQLLTMSLQNVHIPYRRLSICCPGIFYAKMESRPNSTSDKTAVEKEPSTSEIKRVGNTGEKFVIEDSLVQFGQELTDSLTESN